MNNNNNNTVSVGNLNIKKETLLLVVAVALIIAVIAVCFCVFFKSDDVPNDDLITAEGGGTADINLVYLMTSMYKVQYAPILVSNGVTSWNDEVFEGGETWAEMLMGEVTTSLFELLTTEYLYDEVYKQPFTTAQKQAIESQIDALSAAVGSRKALENELSSYSASTKTLERYFELNIKYAALYNYLYGTGGKNAISEDSIKNYFNENYVIVDHIYLSTAPIEKQDGTLVSLTEEEFNEKLDLMQEIYDRITLAGEDFYALKEQYTDDKWQESYYFVTNDDSFPAKFTTAALEMVEGDYVFVQTDAGLHLIHKLPMNAELYNTNTSVYETIKSRLGTVAYRELIDSRLYDQNGDFKSGGIITVPKKMMKKIDSINVLTVKEWAMG